MASYNYTGYGKSSSVNVEKGSSASANGFITNVTCSANLLGVTGQVGLADLYCITVAANDAVVISMKKTSDIGYCAYTVANSSPIISVSDTAQDAASVIGNTANYSGFKKVVTDSGSTRYYLSNFGSDTARTFYVAVNNTHNSYDLKLSDATKLTSLYSLVQSAPSYIAAYGNLSDEAKNSVWNGYNSSVNGISWLVQQKDPVNHEYLYKTIADTSEDLLGEVPLVTYNLSIDSVNDTKAPEWINAADYSSSVKAKSVFVSWGEAVDDWCTESYTAVLTDANGNVINRQTNGLGQGYCCNGLAVGEYVLTVTAADWAGNVQTGTAGAADAPLTVNFTVGEPSEGDFREGFSGTVAAKAVDEKTVTVTESGWFKWTNLTSSTDTLTVELLNSNETISSATLKGDTVTAKDFQLNAGTYTLRVTGKNNASTGYSVCLDSSYIGEGTIYRSFDTAEQITVSGGATTSSGYVGIDKNGGDTAASHYYCYSTASGVRDGRFSVNMGGVQSKVTVTLYNSARKKVSSQTITSSTDGLFAGTLMDSGSTYYVSVASGDMGQGGYNTQYELTFNYDEFPDNIGSGNYKAIQLQDQLLLSRVEGADAYVVKNNTAKSETVAGGTFGAGCTLVDDHWVGYGHQTANFSFTGTDMNGKYTFNLRNLSKTWTTDTASITVYQLKKNAAGEVIGRKKMKSVSTNRTTASAVLSGLLFQQGVEYCIEVTSKNKKGDVDYDLEMDGSTKFFTKANQMADDDWRNLSSACGIRIELADTEDLRRSYTVSAGGTVIEGGTGIFDLGTGTVTSAALITNEWVGNGDLAKNDASQKDLTDYRKLNLNCAGKFSLVLQASEAATLTVYQKSGSGSLKKLKAVSTSSSKTEAVLKDLLLDSGEEYYIAVKSKKSSAGAYADYSVSVGSETCFFPGRNLNDSGWQSGSNNNRFSMKLGNSVFSHVDETGKIVEDPGEKEWVGFGDKEDCIFLTDVEHGYCDLKISGLESKVKVVVYELENGQKKSLCSKTVTPKNGINTEYTLQNLLLGQADREYAVYVYASNWKKAQNTSYVLTVTEKTGFLTSDSESNPYKLGAAENVVASLTKTQGGNQNDYFDLSNWTADTSLSIDADRGKMKVTFYDARWNVMKISAVNAAGAAVTNASELKLTAGNAQSDSMTVGYLSGISYARVEALDKSNDKYSIRYLASASC